MFSFLKLFKSKRGKISKAKLKAKDRLRRGKKPPWYKKKRKRANQKLVLSNKIKTVDTASPFRLPTYYRIWLIAITLLLAVIMLIELLILILPLRPDWLKLVQPACAVIPPQYLSTNQVDVDLYTQQYFANKKPRKSMMVAVSAYSSTIDQTDKTPYLTAYNTQVRDGIVAANFLPVGTVVRFPQRFGDKLFVVEDRMDERFGLQADIWMSKHEDAQKFGIQYLEMEVY